MMWLVFLVSFGFLMDIGLTGWAWSSGYCRDAGVFALNVDSSECLLIPDAGLWNTQQEIKLSKRSTRSAIRTLWADSSTSEKYVDPFKCT